MLADEDSNNNLFQFLIGKVKWMIFLVFYLDLTVHFTICQVSFLIRRLAKQFCCSSSRAEQFPLSFHRKV